MATHLPWLVNLSCFGVISIGRSEVKFRLWGRKLDFQSESSRYTLLVRFNKVETTVPWFCMLHAGFAGYSGYGNSV